MTVYGHSPISPLPVEYQLHVGKYATWCRLPLRQETGQEKMVPGRDLYSGQGQVSISVSFEIELMRMIRKGQTAGLEGVALSAAERFYALVA